MVAVFRAWMMVFSCKSRKQPLVMLLAVKGRDFAYFFMVFAKASNTLKRYVCILFLKMLAPEAWMDVFRVLAALEVYVVYDVPLT